MLSKLPPVVCLRGGGGGGVATGLLNKGGGSNRLPGLATKQQAVEFPQVLTYYCMTGRAIRRNSQFEAGSIGPSTACKGQYRS